VNLHKQSFDLSYFSECVKYLGEIIKNKDVINLYYDPDTGHFVVHNKDDSSKGFAGKSFTELMCNFINKRHPPEYFSDSDDDFLVYLENFIKGNNKLRILASSSSFSIWTTDSKGVGGQVRHFDLLLGLYKAIKFEKEAVDP
jgi:hypothetical protein